MMATFRRQASDPSSDAPEAETLTVLASSTELFSFYRTKLEQCARYTSHQPFVDLCTVFKKWLRVYAEDVLAHSLAPVTASTRRSSSSDGRFALADVARVCLAINTADYCAATAEQLEGRLRDKVDPSLRDRVSLEAEKEALLGSVRVSMRPLNVQRHLERHRHAAPGERICTAAGVRRDESSTVARGRERQRRVGLHCDASRRRRPGDRRSARRARATALLSDLFRSPGPVRGTSRPSC